MFTHSGRTLKIMSLLLHTNKEPKIESIKIRYKKRHILNFFLNFDETLSKKKREKKSRTSMAAASSIAFNPKVCTKRMNVS